jgi:short subunit dehydrogenase-like uncharacterized protein
MGRLLLQLGDDDGAIDAMERSLALDETRSPAWNNFDIHYRSAYRELIAFSNAAYYGGKLNIPVRRPAEDVKRAKPIEVRRVDGLYRDVSTAYATTGIPNIEVYIPGSPAMVARLRRANRLRWLIGTGLAQRFMKRRIERTVKGPSAAKRDAQPTFVWGEVRNARGDKRTARIKTANGYSLTVTGALAVAEHLLANDVPGGAYTPVRLIGSDLLTRLPGSGPLQMA